MFSRRRLAASKQGGSDRSAPPQVSVLAFEQQIRTQPGAHPIALRDRIVLEFALSELSKVIGVRLNRHPGWAEAPLIVRFQHVEVVAFDIYRKEAQGCAAIRRRASR